MANLIIVVDATNGFCKKGAIVDRGIMKSVPNIKKLLARKVKEGWAIIFVADNHLPDDKEFERFPVHCIIGTEEVRVIDELKEFVTKMNYIPKTRLSGFFGTDLKKIIEKENPDKIIIVGAWTELCVHYTIADLCNMDRYVIVPKDCVRARDYANTDLWLNHLKNALGATIVEKQEEI